jgi:hypothetical protein
MGMTRAGDDAERSDEEKRRMTREGLGAWRGGGTPAHSADPAYLCGRWFG